jgi:hypothetical protein
MQYTASIVSLDKIYSSYSICSFLHSGRLPDTRLRFSFPFLFSLIRSAFSPDFPWPCIHPSFKPSIALFLVTQMFDLPWNQWRGSVKDFLQPRDVNVIFFKAEDAFLFSLGTFKRIPLLDCMICTSSMESSLTFWEWSPCADYAYSMKIRYKGTNSGYGNQ